MMTYEEYLVTLRNTGGLPTGELRRLALLKPIAAELAASRRFAGWLAANAGGIKLVTRSADAIAIIERMKASGEVIGLDIETAKGRGSEQHPLAGLHPQLSQIRLVQLFRSSDEGVFVVDCTAAGHAWLQSLAGGRYVAHNAKFEASQLWHLFQQEIDLECTMLAGRVFYDQNLSLEHYAQDHLGISLSKALQTSDWSRRPLLDEQIVYAAGDAVVVKLLWGCFEEMFSQSDPSYQSAYGFLKRLIYPVVRQAGIHLDTAAHTALVAQWQAEEGAARSKLISLGLQNPASVQQRQVWLESQLCNDELDDWPRTATGNLSTKADDLENALSITGARPLAQWSRASSRLSNFGPKLNTLLVNGCLYPHYAIAGMVTGRFGCSQPNIQNQPREGFKHVYRAPDGFKFVTGDLSQIELRVAGLISGDPVINDAYRHGRDLHREVAAERAGKSLAEITKAERQAAKAINFGLLYGAGAETLRRQATTSYGIEMTHEEAAEAKAFFHRKYERLSEWQREIVEETRYQRYSESPHIKLTRHYDKPVYTHAMNFPVQSGAWEILALAILYIDERLPEDGSIRISHHVYDELCLIAKDDQVRAAALLLRDGFLHGFRTVFPEGATRGLVEIGAGRTWEAASLETNRIPEASL
jgi:DNA polymerase I